jgi:hypothetical protein
LNLLTGYHFCICETPGDVAEALDVRRRVYVEASGYRVPVPDEYDPRSWLLLAREASSGEAVGSVRITPRQDTLEAEEYFQLPSRLRTPWAAEISRLAILPAHRKSRTFLPIVSLGLFKLVMRFLERVDAEYMVICSKPERIWTFEWMRFSRTGLSAPYTKLAGAEHELLWYDFKRKERILEGHPFRSFFLEIEYEQVHLPVGVPSLGIPAGTPGNGRLRVTA